MYTFFRYLYLATLGDGDFLGWLVSSTFRNVFDLVDDLVALEDLSEDNVLAVQPAIG